MEFELEYLERDNGDVPVESFLQGLESSPEGLQAKAIAGLRKLRFRDNHGEPFTEPLGNGLFVMRVGDDNIIRIFFIFRPDRKICLLDGYVKKSNKIPKLQLAHAAKLRKEIT